MRILSAAEMRACDERTVREHGIPIHRLMENAGAAVARFARLVYPNARHIAVLCGKGNNGGDGMVAARLLAAEGCAVTTFLLAQPHQLQGAARRALDQLAENPILIQSEADLASEPVRAHLAQAELFIDAIFGTGFRPPLAGLPLALRDAVARHAAPVLAVDMPSGWDADTTAFSADPVFPAHAVLTFTAPKFAHIFGALTGKNRRGPIAVASIGSPEAALQSDANLHWTGSAKGLAEAPRALNANKGNFGHVFVLGGSRGMSGAPAMAALAALRAGAGRVTAAVPEGIASTVAAHAPEIMTLPLAETAAGGIALSNLEALRRQFSANEKVTLALGPGLGREEETLEFVRQFVQAVRLPTVLDADGLHAFAAPHALQQLEGSGRILVLTPHPGEMANLLHTTVDHVEANRMRIAREFAQQLRLTLVLKGWRTLVAHPDGALAANTSGNPGMSKGGSGDVLTGMVAALLAQYPAHVEEAVEAAVWLHGAAADAALAQQNEHTLLATDLPVHLAQAWQAPICHDGFVWLQEGRP
jgi:hydroxyethylthiazole kinase-like uncharacterized protein yjeF